MQLLVCIDDTDNLESRGTGKLAAILADGIGQSGWGRASFITRHQLFVHPDIPYTSHNSAMCFALDAAPPDRQKIIDFAGHFLVNESAPGSDPGLCVVAPAELAQADRLVEYGRAAKSRVLTKEDAYGLARHLGAHLSEHGGSGQGVVGALAGTGLRLGGNDGRLRGRLEIGAAGDVLTAADLTRHPLIDRLQTLDGEPLGPQDRVMLGEKVKTVLLEGLSVLLVVFQTFDAEGPRWQTCPQEIVKRF